MSLASNAFFIGADIVRCSDCGLVYPHPRPSREQVDAFYRESYYSYSGIKGALARRLKLYYSGLRGRHQYRWIMKALDSSGRRSPGSGAPRVLEVGCGYGRLLEHFHNSGWEVQGIEPGEDCASYTARKFASAATGGARQGEAVFHGTFNEFEPTDGVTFDLIVLSHVFEHFIAPEEVIKRLEKLLAPGGSIFFELPNGRAGHYIETSYRLVPDFYFFSVENFSSFVGLHGLETVRTGHIEYQRLLPRYDDLGHAVNYAWWAVLDLFGVSCFREAGSGSIWLRALVRKQG
ncbi:MAG: class I SAM-dependent methyltransferase [Gemmatimonadota bacterium]|nr:class I SAM-dependent methyltransferase [Gemmatimonadota bacterium]